MTDGAGATPPDKTTALVVAPELQAAARFAAALHAPSREIRKAALPTNPRQANTIFADEQPPLIVITLPPRVERQMLRELEPAAFRRAIDQTLRAPFWLTRAGLPAMLRAQWGRFVFVTSSLASTATAGAGHYAAGLRGLTAFARALALECPPGVTANCVAIDDIADGRALRDAQRAIASLVAPDSSVSGQVLNIAGPPAFHT